MCPEKYSIDPYESIRFLMKYSESWGLIFQHVSLEKHYIWEKRKKQIKKDYMRVYALYNTTTRVYAKMLSNNNNLKNP